MSRDRSDEDRDYEPRERPTRRERAARRKNKKKHVRRDAGDGPRPGQHAARPSRRDLDAWEDELDWDEEEEEEQEQDDDEDDELD